MDHHNGRAADKATPMGKHQPAGIRDTHTAIRWQAAEEFSPKTGVNFGENKTKNNIWDVLTGKPAWLIGFPLFCVQIDNDSR